MANYMPHVLEFMKAWDHPEHPWNTQRKRLLTTAFGNITSDGVAGGYKGPMLGPKHPDFERAIERGVTPLVLTLVHRHALITYSSCEGHHYGDQKLEPVARWVGILPRNDDERASILDLLTPVVKAETCWALPVQPRIVRRVLDSKDGTFEVVDLLLMRRWGSWRLYFAVVDHMCGRLVGRLQSCDRRSA